MQITATPIIGAQSQSEQLLSDISKIQQELLDKQATLNALQEVEIERLISAFMHEVEKNQFNKTRIKQIIVEKLKREKKLKPVKTPKSVAKTSE